MNWSSCRLVIFDVDGTLYDQKRLRLLMASSMLIAAARQRDLQFIRIISLFRKLREKFAEEEVADFEPQLYALTAQCSGCSEPYVRSLIAEWIDRRPLPYLKSCMFHGIDTLFDRLRKSGRRIGIFSDYPSAEKLKSMGLDADILVSADDPGVGRLKPNPKGLLQLLKIADVPPDQAVFIGDRFERDGAAGRMGGVATLIRSAKSHDEFLTFKRYNDAVFKPILDGH